MTWTGDPRTGTTAWRQLRLRILRRDHGICHVCGKPGANEVDHLTPTSAGGTDDPSNLAAIHAKPCHARKSSAEGNHARWHRASKRRDPEPHPGVI